MSETNRFYLLTPIRGEDTTTHLSGAEGGRAMSELALCRVCLWFGEAKGEMVCPNCSAPVTP